MIEMEVCTTAHRKGTQLNEGGGVSAPRYDANHTRKISYVDMVNDPTE